MTDAVSVERHGDIVVLEIDIRPSMRARRQTAAGCWKGGELLKSDDARGAAVISGAGNTFIAGSDPKEFGQP